MSYYYDNYGGGRGGFLASIPPATKKYRRDKHPSVHRDVDQPAVHGGDIRDVLSGVAALPSMADSHTHVHARRLLAHILQYVHPPDVRNRVGTGSGHQALPDILLRYYLGAAALHTGVEWIQDQVFIANGAHIAHQILMNTPTLGASGAIYGVLIGYAMCYPNSRLTLLFPPVTLTAKWFVIIFAIIELGTSCLRNPGRRGTFRPSRRYAVRLAAYQMVAQEG